VVGGVMARVRTIDEFDGETLRPSEEQRAGVVALLLPQDDDARAPHAVAQPGPLRDPEREVIDAADRRVRRRVPEPQHLIPEEEEAVLRPLPDRFEAELVDEEPPGLLPVPNAEVDVVEPEDLDLGGRWCHGDLLARSPRLPSSVSGGGRASTSRPRASRLGAARR